MMYRQFRQVESRGSLVGTQVGEGWGARGKLERPTNAHRARGNAGPVECVRLQGKPEKKSPVCV